MPSFTSPPTAESKLPGTPRAPVSSIGSSHSRRMRVHARMPASAKSAATSSLCDGRFMPCVVTHDATPSRPRDSDEDMI